MDLSSAVCSDPYLCDGNVVLAARAEGGVWHVFRVHQSVLCRQSTNFTDMFAIPAPTDPAVQETHDGAALVRMPDDAKDLGDLLKMMYDPSCVAPDSCDGVKLRLPLRARKAHPYFPPGSKRADSSRRSPQAFHKIRDILYPLSHRPTPPVCLATVV